MSTTYDIDNLKKGYRFTFDDKGEYDVSEGGEIVFSFEENADKVHLSSPLPMDLDIFDIALDKRIQTKQRAKDFLERLKLYIQQKNVMTSLENVHFNKLSIEDQNNEGELMVDWIYNYFRVFYSFDDKEGDMYGMIVNDTERVIFASEFKQLKETNYDDVAKETVEFVLENIRR